MRQIGLIVAEVSTMGGPGLAVVTREALHDGEERSFGEVTAAGQDSRVLVSTRENRTSDGMWILTSPTELRRDCAWPCWCLQANRDTIQLATWSVSEEKLLLCAQSSALLHC